MNFIQFHNAWQLPSAQPSSECWSHAKRCARCLSINLWVFCFFLYFISKSMPIIWATVVFDTSYFLPRSRWRDGSVQSMSFPTFFTTLFVRTSGLPGFLLCFLLEDFFRAFFLWHWWCYWLSSRKLKTLLVQDFCLPFCTTFKSGTFPKHTLLQKFSFVRGLFFCVFSTIFKDKNKNCFL